MEKITYVKALEIAIASVEAVMEDDLISFDGIGEFDMTEVAPKLEALKAQVAKKRTKSDKPTKAQREKAEADAVLTAEIFDGMVVGTDYTTAQCGEIVGVSTSKAVHLMKPLVESGAVTKGTVKGSTIYRVAVDGE